MPRLRPYESQLSTQADVPAARAQPSDFGGTGLSNLGEAVQDAGVYAGQANRILLENKARREVTDAQIQLLNLQQDLARGLDERVKTWKPGDVSVADDMAGVIKGQLDNLGQTEDGNERYETQNGKKAFQVGAARLQQHFSDQLAHADAQLQGKAAEIQHRELVDNAGNFLQTHPTYFALRREQVEGIIMDPNGTYGKVPYVTRQKLAQQANESLAISAVQGFIRQHPNQALQTLQDPLLKQDEQYGWISQYIPNEKLSPLIGQAQTAVMAQDAESARAAAEENRQRINRARTAESALIEKMALHMASPTEPDMTAQDVLESPLMQDDPQKALQLLQIIHARSKEDPQKPVHTNPAVERRLFKSIHLPDGDPHKIIDTAPIYDAYIKQQLSSTDMERLRRELVEARTPEGSVFGKEKAEFLKRVEPRITHPGPFGIYSDPTTADQFYNFERDVEAAITQYRKEGKDPRELFDPRSHNYMGRPEVVDKYQNKTFGSLQPGGKKPEKSLDDIFGAKK